MTLSSSRRFSAALAVTVSSLTLLAACSSLEGFKQAATGERRAQVVDGARRAPMMNPQQQPQAKSAPRAPQPMAAPPSYPSQDTASAARNPYDYYDASGKPAGPKTTAGEQASGQGNFFGRMFGGPGADMTRKPLPGNPYYSDETAQAAPASPAPQATTAAPATTPLLSNAPVSDYTLEHAADAPAPEPQEGNFFSRLANNIKRPFQSKSADGASAPELSSVPPVPEQFGEVKAERQQQMEELQGEHMQAQSEKQALDSEPSQYSATVPVETSGDKTVPPVNVQPLPVPMSSQDPAPLSAPPIPGGPGEPVLLGHVASPAEIAAQEQAAAAAPQEVTRRPNWWEGWNMSGQKEAPAAMEPVAAPVAQPQPELQPLVAPPPAVAAVTAQPEPEEKEAMQDTALPSPQILREVKTLPPSRYSGRMQSYQHPLETQ
jgi:hypothetical protein